MDKISQICLIFTLLTVAVYSDYCVKREFNTLECNYIPVDIPTGVLKVKIVDFLRETKFRQINSSFFQSENWGQIKSLELRDEAIRHPSGLKFFARCFSGLKMLHSLRIHVAESFDYLDSDAFLGLDTVKTLDLSDCIRLTLKQLLPALLGTKKLARLQKLLMSNFGTITHPHSFDSSFFLALKDKNITYLDISRTQISMLNFTAAIQTINQLKGLNVSYSIISETVKTGMNASDLMHIDIVDGSYAVFPKSWISEPFGKILISNYTIENLDSRGKLDLLFACKVINVTGIISVPNSIWIENCKVKLTKPFNWRTRGLIARHNNIKRLDVKMLCPEHMATNIEHVDISYNGIEFIHPSILRCMMRNISKLDMSGNQLSKMVKESLTLFEEMFQSLIKLNLVSLSRNNLEIIPKGMFENNVEIKEIDLSYNKLYQITFNVCHMKKLRIVDLRGNQLKVLDAKSIAILNSISKTLYGRNSSTALYIQDNPFSCSKRSTKQSIRWLARTRLSPTSYSQHLTCLNEDGNKEVITTETVEMIQKICNRKTIITSTSISAGVLSLIIGISVFVIYKRKKHARMIAKVERVLQNFVDGQEQFEFVTFLSHSSEDKDFVETYVYNQLNENLQIMTGIDRTLVCTGDEYLRPGFMILDETIRCIERASVVIAVVSNSYCDSHYCHNELDQAYRLNKPIILVLKEHVDENIMMPTMKMIFKTNVRILWTIENGVYGPTMTWKNVCKSVLELIAQDI